MLKRPRPLGDTGKHKKPTWYSAAEASAIGIELVVALGVGYLLGAWLDRRFGTRPWFTIICFLAGVGAAVKAMVRVARAYQRENASEDDQNDGS